MQSNYIASGAWRNGRRASLRNWWAQARAGSSPAAPTIVDSRHPHGCLFYTETSPAWGKQMRCTAQRRNAWSRKIRHRFDYQSVRHCSKTLDQLMRFPNPFDYQSVRHCSKTSAAARPPSRPFDYQSVRHCSKTAGDLPRCLLGLITSQFDTAPKHTSLAKLCACCLITSQFDTAPKLSLRPINRLRSLITSQFDTAPKPKGDYQNAIAV